MAELLRGGPGRTSRPHEHRQHQHAPQQPRRGVGRGHRRRHEAVPQLRDSFPRVALLRARPGAPFRALLAAHPLLVPRLGEALERRRSRVAQRAILGRIAQRLADDGEPTPPLRLSLGDPRGPRAQRAASPRAHRAAGRSWLHRRCLLVYQVARRRARVRSGATEVDGVGPQRPVDLELPLLPRAGHDHGLRPVHRESQAAGG
mmetsp:Transcript_117698/g.375113  ORF Transcript_117698/g.375113 Transcript_117698/m.375113 type:complete len:203 (+) Transcript_117698:766-1374(+)